MALNLTQRIDKLENMLSEAIMTIEDLEDALASERQNRINAINALHDCITELRNYTGDQE